MIVIFDCQRGAGERLLKADLEHYAALHAQTYGEAVDAATLIPHMLEAFMAGDRGFKRKSASISR